MVSRCNIYSVWSFTRRFNSKNGWFAKILHKPVNSIRIFLPAGTETKFLDDEHTLRLYTPNTSNIYPKTSKTIHAPLSKKFHWITQWLSSKLATCRTKRSPKSRPSKISKKISELTRRRTSLHKRRIVLSSPKGLQLISLITIFVIKRLT